jgi:hypothetical protein
MMGAAEMKEDSVSSEEEESPVWGGSRPGKASNKSRDFEGAHEQLVKHDFRDGDSLHNETDFSRRFGMPRSVFMKLLREV